MSAQGFVLTEIIFFTNFYTDIKTVFTHWKWSFSEMYVWENSPMTVNTNRPIIFFCFAGFWQGAAAPLSRTSPRRPGRFQRTLGERRTNIPKMNTIVFNKLNSQVLFEEKANEVERSSRNYLEVIDGQHPDLLASSPVIKDSSAIRHRRSGYVSNFSVFCQMYTVGSRTCFLLKKKKINNTPKTKQMHCKDFHHVSLSEIFVSINFTRSENSFEMV